MSDVRPRVRSFESFVLRRAYRQSYVGGDNAVISWFGWHVFNDDQWPTFAGPGARHAYLDYLREDPVWIRDAFEVSYAAWKESLDATWSISRARIKRPADAGTSPISGGA